MYFSRPLIQKGKNKVEYFKFNAERYKNYSFYCEADIVSESEEKLDSVLKEIDSLDKYDKKEIKELLGGKEE